jgi:archaellum component FlaC
MDIIQILTIVLIVSVSALCIALIYYLNKVVKSVQSVNNNISELSANLKPLIQSTLELSENLNKITSEAKNQMNISKSILNDFRERADKLLSIENKIRSGVEDAFMPFINNIHAIGKGVETFWRNFKNK